MTKKPTLAMLVMLALLVICIAANMVHGKAGVAGFFVGGGRPQTWLVTLGLIAAMLVVAGYAVCGRWDGIFIDKDNRISLSRFQLVGWTILLVSALLTAGLTNAAAPADPGPLLITIPEQIWALLGLGAFTAVASPAIKDGKRNPPPAGGGRQSGPAPATAEQNRVAENVKDQQALSAEVTFDNHVLKKALPADARWIDLIMGDYEGAANVDISKLQQLAFTLMLIAIYAMDLMAVFASQGAITPTHPNGTNAIHVFPTIDGGFIALLGISHATYLADKQIAAT
ncbi:MAG TPA: hypothetical protein VGW40_12285 [Allosphingosinicella sp.]|nr:hypothetical protein [Allosphingosinicella sp.]